MRYLFINTAVCVSTVALIENNKIVSIREEFNAGDLSSKIFLMIDQVFKEGNCFPKNLDKIFVTNGPGSFTGIRIGLSIAKTMAWALNIELIPISSLELLATTPSETELLIPVIDARRDFVYAGVYNQKLDISMSDRYIQIEELLNKYSHLNVTYISYDSFEKMNIRKPAVDILKVIKKHENDIVGSCHNINPVYLKLTEAEETRKKDEN